MEKEQLFDRESLNRDIEEHEKNKRKVETQVCELEQLVKTKEYEKLFYEVKMNKLKTNINFYQQRANEFQNRLQKTKEIYSQFDIADQYCTRILGIYKDTYFQQETHPETGNNKSTVNENSLSVELEGISRHIQEQNNTIQHLVKELNIS